MDARHLLEAIELAERSVASGGGPFGALVVHAGAVVGRGTNEVVLRGDPTAHAEVLAIRAACQALGTHVLADCRLFASCEPCPMCLGAIHWARLEEVQFAATRRDAARAGFDDELLHREAGRPIGERLLPTRHVPLPEAGRPFVAWAEKADRRPY